MKKFKITTKQMEILDLLCEGYSQVEIAEELNMNLRTLQTYMLRLKNKFTSYSTAQMVGKYTVYKLQKKDV